MGEEQPAKERPATTWGRRAPWIAAGALLLIVLGFAAWRYYGARESTDDAQIDGHLTPVSARIAGAVRSVEVADNQYVEAGAVLVQIDSRDYEVARDRARADLADAEAIAVAARINVPVTATTTESVVQTAGNDQVSAEARLRSAQARLREAVAKETKAVQDLDRLKKLVAKDEVSRQEYDTVSVVADEARAGREAAESGVKEAEQGVQAAGARLTQARTAPQQLAMMRARVASADARVDQAKTSVARAELDLEHTVVRAPAAGIVSKKSVEVGQVIQPGQPLLAIVPLADVWVTANFKEGQLRKLRRGQSVSISVDAYGRSYRGLVDSVAPATGARFSLLPAENATGNYVKVVQRVPVKIVFEKGQDPDHELRPGMSVVPTVFIQ
jgi:membrane fusion protein (multidrug efflux system)